MRGRKPKPVALRLIQGNPGRRPLPIDEGPQAIGALVKPALTGRASEIWDATVKSAPWLTAADQIMVVIFCHLSAQLESDPELKTSRIATLKGVASDLGLSPSGRFRMGKKYRDDDQYDPNDPVEAFLRNRPKS
jgi:hypothetical protein